MTSRVASVPPVEAPRPTSTRSSANPPPRTGVSTATEGLRSGTERGLAMEATSTFCVRLVTKTSLLSCTSGLRTKSTAPAFSASKTFRFREEHRITGTGLLGRYSFRKSMPLCPGISTSMVTTSGRKRGSFCFASKVLMAYPMTSILGWAERPWIIRFRARAESSTTNTRIFFPSSMLREPPPSYFWKVAVAKRR